MVELTVAAILQKHYGNIHTFTIGFNEAKYNEATYAKQHLGTNHTEKFLDSTQAKDEPFGGISISSRKRCRDKGSS